MGNEGRGGVEWEVEDSLDLFPPEKNPIPSYATSPPHTSPLPRFFRSLLIPRPACMAEAGRARVQPWIGDHHPITATDSISEERTYNVSSLV